MPSVLQQIGAASPDLLVLINNNKEAFLRMMGEPMEEGEDDGEDDGDYEDEGEEHDGMDEEGASSAEWQSCKCRAPVSFMCSYCIIHFPLLPAAMLCFASHQACPRDSRRWRR